MNDVASVVDRSCTTCDGAASVNVLLPRVFQATILLLTESDVLNVLRLVLELNINQQLVRQLRIVVVLRVLQLPTKQQQLLSRVLN